MVLKRILFNAKWNCYVTLLNKVIKNTKFFSDKDDYNIYAVKRPFSVFSDKKTDDTTFAKRKWATDFLTHPDTLRLTFDYNFIRLALEKINVIPDEIKNYVIKLLDRIKTRGYSGRDDYDLFLYHVVFSNQEILDLVTSAPDKRAELTKKEIIIAKIAELHQLMLQQLIKDTEITPTPD